MNELQRKGRRTLLLITAIFFLPIFVAMLIYYSGSNWRPATSTVRGELINPPIALPTTSLTADPADQLREIWTMLVLAEDSCDALCVETLEHIRQIRLSLGPKMARIQTALLPASLQAANAFDKAEHPALIVADPERTAALRALIGSYQNGEVLLVDPLGNLMMRYRPNSDMADIRKDLAHLFNLSGIG